MKDLSAPAASALRAAQETIVAHCLDRISSDHPWYRTLPPSSREQIATVAAVGVGMFVDTIDTPADAVAPSEIFTVAPPTLTTIITLEQTLALVRTVVDVVVEEAPQAVPEEDQDTLTILVLTFGRDVGFAAAAVYARAAEARGAWGARLESVAVDTMLREGPTEIAARAGAAGWSGSGPALALAARASLDAMAASSLRHLGRQLTRDCLVSVRGDCVIVVLGGGLPDSRHAEADDAALSPKDLEAAALAVAGNLEGTVVLGPVVGEVSQAGTSLRAAISGLRAHRAWSQAPSPIRADDLLPERLIAGDELAAARLRELVYEPLVAMGEPFAQTVAMYLEFGRSLEATARAMFVHANTVRYRLGRVSEQIGWDATDARDSLVLHMALIAARLDGKDAL